MFSEQFFFMVYTISRLLIKLAPDYSSIVATVFIINFHFFTNSPFRLSVARAGPQVKDLLSLLPCVKHFNCTLGKIYIVNNFCMIFFVVLIFLMVDLALLTLIAWGER